jgi:hypothetical protein
LRTVFFAAFLAAGLRLLAVFVAFAAFVDFAAFVAFFAALAIGLVSL